MQDDDRTGRQIMAMWRLLAVFYLVLFAVWLMMLAITAAPAHGEFAWIMQHQNANGERCCGPVDCVMIPEDRVTVVPAGYRLPNGEIVPFNETKPSEDEKYWRCHRPDGSRRCFFAPHMGL